MSRTRVQITCVIEHAGDGLLPVFALNHFIEAGCRDAFGKDCEGMYIEPGAKLVLSRARGVQSKKPKRPVRP